MRIRIFRFLVLSALFFSLFTPFHSAHAATFNVNSPLDAVDANLGDGVCLTAGGSCTLRAAIQQANALIDADTINLPAGTYTLTIPGSGEDASATGDLDITRDLSIIGAGASTTIIQAGTMGVGGPPNGIDRVMHILIGPASTVNISGVTIRNGNLTGDGGGLYSSPSIYLNITDCIFSGNSASANGAAMFLSAGEVTITNTTFSGNNAGMGAGAILNNGAYVTLTKSTFSGNHSNSSGFGGGGGIVNGNEMTIVNSTFSGNTAVNNGGGILNSSAKVISITNSTFSGNSALSGGAIYSANTDTLVLYNTIVANSISGGNCGGTTITNGASNIDDGTTCGWAFATGSMSSTDPLLGSLANNGGPTQTFALLFGSPAINTGNDGICNAAVGDPFYGAGGLDQRGIVRPQGLHCDIGAYEGFVYRTILPLVYR